MLVIPPLSVSPVPSPPPRAVLVIPPLRVSPAPSSPRRVAVVIPRLPELLMFSHCLARTLVLVALAAAPSSQLLGVTTPRVSFAPLLLRRAAAAVMLLWQKVLLTSSQFRKWFRDRKPPAEVLPLGEALRPSALHSVRTSALMPQPMPSPLRHALAAVMPLREPRTFSLRPDAWTPALAPRTFSRRRDRRVPSSLLGSSLTPFAAVLLLWSQVPRPSQFAEAWPRAASHSMAAEAPETASHATAVFYPGCASLA